MQPDGAGHILRFGKTCSGLVQRFIDFATYSLVLVLSAEVLVIGSFDLIRRLRLRARARARYVAALWVAFPRRSCACSYS